MKAPAGKRSGTCQYPTGRASVAESARQEEDEDGASDAAPREQVQHGPTGGEDGHRWSDGGDRKRLLQTEFAFRTKLISHCHDSQEETGRAAGRTADRFTLAPPLRSSRWFVAVTVVGARAGATQTDPRLLLRAWTDLASGLSPTHAKVSNVSTARRSYPWFARKSCRV